MRKVRQKMVTLAAPDGTKQEFEVKHAERLLDMGPNKNGGWMLPEDSEYIYDEYDGLRIKSNKANSAEA